MHLELLIKLQHMKGPGAIYRSTNNVKGERGGKSKPDGQGKKHREGFPGT